jgi:hypothetical protein
MVNDITGVSFQNYNGYDALYSDCRTGMYNCYSDDLNYGSGIYHHNGNFSLWAGPEADARGVIVDFTNNDGTWFETGYSSYSNFYVEAWLTDGSMVSASGSSNLGSAMNYLYVEASAGLYIDYLVLHDSGNYWIVDDLSGDATGISTSVPEPGALALLGLGLVGLGFSKRRKAA